MRSVNYIVPRDHIQSTTFLILFIFVLHDTSSHLLIVNNNVHVSQPGPFHHLSTYVGGRYESGGVLIDQVEGESEGHACIKRLAQSGDRD